MKRLLLSLLITVLTFFQIAQAQPGLPAARILSVDSSDYPALDLYVSVIDRETRIPITTLTADDFFVDTDTGETLTIESVSQERRPLYVVVVLDNTGSVSEIELRNQANAVRALAARLAADDRLAVVVSDEEKAQLLVGLQSNPPELNSALESLSVREDATGNVFWDGVQAGLTVLQNVSGDARRAVIVISDITANSAEGAAPEEDIIATATENNIEIYGLYFEYEGDGIPPNPPVLPPELTVISESSNGFAFGVEGELRAGSAEQDYTDDDALPTLIQSLAGVLISEYHLALNAPLLADGVERGLNLTITYQGATLPSVRSQFMTGVSPVTVNIPELANGDRVSLPLSIMIEAESAEGSIVAVTAYQLDETGQRTRLAEISPDDLNLTLHEDDVLPGILRLIVEARDSNGHIGKGEVEVRIVQVLTVSLAQIPQEVETGETLNLKASIGMAETAISARLLINGEEVETRTEGPFNELNFEWEPLEPGQYTIEVFVDDVRGTTATSQQTVTVTGTAIARRSDSESGSISRILAAAASIAVAITIIVVGRKFIRRFSGRSAAYPDIPHTRTTDIFPDEAEDMPYLSSQGYEAPTSQSQPPPVSGRQAIALLEDTTGKQWMIYQGENTIGRHGSNTVQIHDESVSRYHAKITVNGGHCHF
ncbi:MAG TPA: VWA domain-containing protein, partial [Aggregatilineales bacterium]|nr:VWA domain-containing protein [Aggregatilineales bacterium]